ncbi:LysR family transcriptional regulator [Microbacterium sp. No. 7]|uniref:LysR family transcriptional regulator n=1 Tax=Microbacterium sp. No. 7 TaxID=1714373 RepID=UPI0006D18570|nr:LysR family transcriptional regulator [Microbacterium sp. No. 7]ALJ18452.1 hypothetical protein AOA12_00370 [Microbacterium sp. No. 7]
MLEIEKLHQFAVLARHGSYTAAAAVLHVSQPTLTRSIQSLENTLQTRLLDRGRNGIELTTIGVDVLHHAENLLRHASNIEADIASRSRGVRGHVRIGAGPMVGASVIPHVVSDILNSGLDISVSTVLSKTSTMYAMLLEGELDFFLSRQPNPAWGDKLETTVVGLGRPQFFVRPEHPLASANAVTFADLGEYPRMCATAWNEVLRMSNEPELAQLLYATIESDDTGILTHISRETDTILISTAGMLTGDLVALDIADRGDALPGDVVTLNRPAQRTLSPAALHVIEIAHRRAIAAYGSVPAETPAS